MTDPQLYRTATEIQLYAALLLKFLNLPLEERLQAYGQPISSLQHGILRMLAYEPLTISEIGQRMGLDPSTIGRAVDALEKKKLAQRHIDPHDRRRHPIHITDEGMDLFYSVPVIAPQDSGFQVLDGMGIEAATQLRNLLRAFIKEFPEGKMIIALMEQAANQK